MASLTDRVRGPTPPSSPLLDSGVVRRQAVGRVEDGEAVGHTTWGSRRAVPRPVHYVPAHAADRMSVGPLDGGTSRQPMACHARCEPDCHSADGAHANAE
jgi:hypothetical protein